MAAIRSLLVKVLADTAELVTGMTEASECVSETCENIQEMVGGVQEAFEGLLAAVAVEKIVEAASAAEDAMAQLQAAVRQTGATTGSTSQSVTELAESLARMNGATSASVISMEAVFASFNRVGSNVLPKTSQAAMDLAARFKMDLPAAAKLVGMALQNPEKGMTRLQRAGVFLTQTQKDQVKAFLAVNDAADAQKIILDAIEQSCGGAAAAARDTLGGAMRAVQAGIESVAEAIAGGNNGSLRFALELLDDILQQAAKHGPELTAAINGIVAAGTTLIGLQLGQKFMAFVVSLGAGEIASTALVTGGLSVLIGVLVAVGSTSTKTGQFIRDFAGQVLKFAAMVANSWMQMGTTVIDVGKGIFQTLAGDFTGAAVSVQTASRDMNRYFVTEFANPVMAEIKKVTDAMSELHERASSNKGGALNLNSQDLLGGSKKAE